MSDLAAGSFRSALGAWAGMVAARPRAVTAASILLAILAFVHTVENLGLDTSTTEMISSEVPFRQNALAYKSAFPTFEDPIVAVIDGTTPEAAKDAAAKLAQTLSLDDERFSAVAYPAGDPFFAEHGLLYLGVDELDDLGNELAAAQPLLAALAEDPSLRGISEFVALALNEGRTGGAALPGELDQVFADMAAVVEAQLENEPGDLSWNELLGADPRGVSTRQIVLIQPRLSFAVLNPGKAAVGAVREAIAGLDLADDIQVRLTGPIPLDVEELQSVRAGATLAGILTAIAVTCLLVIGLRSWQLIVATLATLAIGLVLTGAFATLTIGSLNLISVTFAVLFVGLGVDFGIHVALRYREALAQGHKPPGALSTTAASIGGALTLTAVCAALGFLSFAPTDYRGLAELGVISAGGMAIAWFTSLTTMPAILALLPFRKQPEPSRAARGGDWVVGHRRLVLGLLGAAGLAAVVVLPALEFDFNPLNLKDPETESVATFLDLAADPTTSPYTIDILVDGTDEAAGAVRAVEAVEGVGRALAIGDFVPVDQDEKLDIIEFLDFQVGPFLLIESGAAPEPAELEAAVRALADNLETADGAGGRRLQTALERLIEVAGGGEDPYVEADRRLAGGLPAFFEQLRTALGAGPVTLDDLPASIRNTWIGRDGEIRISVRPAEPISDNAELRRFADAVLSAVPDATGTPVVVTEASRVVVGAFRDASLIAGILILVVLALLLRNVRDVALVLLPLLWAVVLTGATAAALGLALNFANVIVMPLLFGLGVSGAIHVVLREREGSDAADFFASSTPRAVLFSALTTVASFGSLAVSDHMGMASMGLLLTIAIAWSLVSTLVFLPALIATLRTRSAVPT